MMWMNWENYLWHLRLTLLKGFRYYVFRREKYKGVNSFGHLLFDLRDDPQQQHPIHDEAIEARMINLLIRLMKENDAPAEQYRRLGLDVI